MKTKKGKQEPHFSNYHNIKQQGKKNPGICIPGKKTKNQLTFKPPGDFVPVDKTPKCI